MKRAIFYQDYEQSFWQLASIQAATFGLSGLLLGKALALQFGAGTAILSIAVGNLFLWVIALAIIGMSSNDRSHAIANAQKFIGKFGSVIMALVLMAAILFWFTIQIKVSVDALEEVFQNSPLWKKSSGVRIGIAFGFFISILSIGGIRLIKWVCVGSLPLLFFYLLFLIFQSHHHVILSGTWGIALPAVITTIAANLAAIVNLPTFFRHSRSRSDSFLALTFMTLFFTFFQCASIWLNGDNSATFAHTPLLGISRPTFMISMTLFISLALICVNLANIYWASVGWEVIAPIISGPKEYAIVGLAGTAAFTFMQTSQSMLISEEIATNIIANLGMVLLIGFLITIFVRHRLRPMERFLANVCWFMGTLVAVVTQMQMPSDVMRPFVYGVSGSVLTFIFILFIEEPIWAIKSVKNLSKIDRD